jgi:endonuclease/exonuclease/phosphatase (EEP) superfamily protein YafD
MHPLRLLSAATAMEISAAAAALAVAGLCGWRSGWLDVINSFAPIILAMALIGAVLALVSLDRGATRGAVLALAGLAGLYGLALILPELWGRWPGPAGEGAVFSVLSANVWHDNPSPDLAVAEIIARAPDAVLLQEADGSLAALLPRLTPLYPYSSACPGSGVRILVKSPITARGCETGPRRGADLDLVWIRTTGPDGAPLTLATTHLAWPFPPRPYEAQRKALAAEMARLPSGEVILTGDFNTTPWTFAMRRQDAALRPLTRRTRAWFSWPARLDALRRPWSLPILPIDHIYTGRDWGLVGLTRVRIPGSDHFATEARLRRR